MLLALIAIVLTLILVIGIHEGGHALAARALGVTIKKISIGFGRPLFSWKTTNSCEWVWAIIPLGGYVQLENTRISSVAPSDYSGCFDKKPIGSRIVILLAGVVANLSTAWIALVFVSLLGLSYSLPQIKSVQPESPAAVAGMVAGDQFIKIGGHATPSWNEVGMQLVILWGKKDIPVVLSSDRGTKLKHLRLDLNQLPFSGLRLTLLARLGIVPNLSADHALLRAPTLGKSIEQANNTLLSLLYFFLMIFKQLVTGVIPFSTLLGPLGMFKASIASLTQGLAVFLFYIASLSLSVALVNLFPVPGLDGGAVVYALIEKIRKKPISIAMEILLHRLVLIFFCLMLVHLLMNDLQRF